MAEATVAAPQNVMRDLKIEKLVISKFRKAINFIIYFEKWDGRSRVSSILVGQLCRLVSPTSSHVQFMVHIYKTNKEDTDEGEGKRRIKDQR